MIVEFKNNNCFNKVKDILIRDEKKSLKIFYGSNFDLYIDIFGDHNIDENGYYNATFSINQSQEIYQYFETLIDNIIKCKVFDVSGSELEMRNTKGQINNIHNRLVQDSAIVWYSDNIYDEKANKLKIEKKDDEIILTFTDNPDDPTFGFGIRICNSGSKYDPFNLCFMNLFNQLQLLNKQDEQKKLVLK